MGLSVAGAECTLVTVELPKRALVEVVETTAPLDDRLVVLTRPATVVVVALVAGVLTVVMGCVLVAPASGSWYWLSAADPPAAKAEEGERIRAGTMTQQTSIRAMKKPTRRMLSTGGVSQA